MNLMTPKLKPKINKKMHSSIIEFQFKKKIKSFGDSLKRYEENTK